MKKTFLIFTLMLVVSWVSAQCAFKFGANEEDSILCVGKVNEFKMYYQQKNYPDAYSPWQYVVNNCPCSWSGVFAYAQPMLEGLIKEEKDSVRRERLIDSLLWVYDNYHVYHPKFYTQGKGIGYKSYYMMKYRKNYDEIFDGFVQSVELERENTQPMIWDYYFRLATQMAIAKRDTTIVIEAYERATEYIDDAKRNAWKAFEADTAELAKLMAMSEDQISDKREFDKQVKKYTEDTTRQMKLVDNYTKTFAKIETMFIPYAECDILEQVYSKKIESVRENIPAAKKMLLTMHKRGCQSSPTYRTVLEIVHNNEPSAQTASMMGGQCIAAGEYGKAKDYLMEAISLFETNEEKVESYYLLGLINYKQGNFPEARNNAYAALRINPNYGKAYILIGDLYAASAGRCNTNDPNEIPGAVYWAAADKYNKAAAVDPSVAADANSRRSKLPGVSFEAAFKAGYNKGQSYRVGCWVQETTTVR
ncbi:MAG: hypothetical protein IJT04_00560 [Bacteroidales bacterium]|nr:hypothetical protein [Bacteroidales bacterium]